MCDIEKVCVCFKKAGHKYFIIFVGVQFPIYFHIFRMFFNMDLLLLY